MLPLPTKVISAILLFFLILNSLLKKKTTFKEADYHIYVPDIHCRHCKITLEGKLKELEGIDDVQVDIEEKVVKLKGKVNKEQIYDIIEKSGYTPQKGEN